MEKTTNLLKSYKRYYIEAGKTYGKYTTLEQVDYTTKSGNIEKRWKCKDSKGNISYRRARSLDCIEQSDALCDEINKELVFKNIHQPGLRRALYVEYKHNAEHRQHNFNLSFSEFNNLITQPCFYCGAEPNIKNGGHLDKRKNKDQPDLFTNGIDRIDSTKDYTIDNCVSCCSMCNMMKNTYSLNDFLNHVSNIYNHQVNLKESSETIPQGSTLEANASGSGSPQ